jgi:tetratricopeptide (TPR) repeat protein
MDFILICIPLHLPPCPGVAANWHALGSRLVASGDRAGALIAFRMALRLEAGRRDSERALGNLLFDCGRIDQAVGCFERAGLEWNPTGS